MVENQICLEKKGVNLNSPTEEDVMFIFSSVLGRLMGLKDISLRIFE